MKAKESPAEWSVAQKARRRRMSSGIERTIESNGGDNHEKQASDQRSERGRTKHEGKEISNESAEIASR